MLDRYIAEFVASNEMKEFLKQTNHSVDNEADTIYHAPAPLEKKKNALMQLLKEAKDSSDLNLIEGCELYLKAISEAERLMNADGVYSVEIVSYDDKEGESDYEFDGLFNNFDDLVQYIKKNLEDYEVSDGAPWYYRAVKWINDENCKLVEACTYWIVRGEIWFAEVEDFILDDYRLSVYRAVDLNLSVPFKAGDIVEIDLYPFADKRILEIIEVGDNHDCCCLQALSRNVDGEWNVGAVKHGHIGIDILPCVSPLYTMTIFKGELPPEYKVLLNVSKFIDGQEEKGAVFWEVMSRKNDIADEEVLELIGKAEEGKI